MSCTVLEFDYVLPITTRTASSWRALPAVTERCYSVVLHLYHFFHGHDPDMCFWARFSDSKVVVFMKYAGIGRLSPPMLGAAFLRLVIINSRL